MRINKVSDYTAANTFFDIMSKFNDIEAMVKNAEENISSEDYIEYEIRKESSLSGPFSGLLIKLAVAGGLKNLTKLFGEAAQTGVAAAKSSDEVARALKSTVRAGTGSGRKFRIYGQGYLLKGAKASQKGASFQKAVGSIRGVLDSVSKDSASLAKFVDASGNITPSGVAKLNQAVKASGAISDDVLDGHKLLVKNILDGSAFTPATKAAVKEVVPEAAKGGGKAVKEVVPEAAKGGGKAGKEVADEGAKVVAKPTGKLSDSAAEITRHSAGNNKALSEIQNAFRAQKEAAKSAAAAGKLPSLKHLDDAAKAAEKLQPEALRSRALYAIQDTRNVIQGEVRAAQQINQVFAAHGNVFRNAPGGKMTVNMVQNATQDMDKILRVMDDAATSGINRMSGLKGSITQFNKASNMVKGGKTVVKPTTEVLQEGGEAAAKIGDIVVSPTINVGGGAARGAAGAGDDLLDANAQFLKIHIEKQTEALEFLMKHMDEIDPRALKNADPRAFDDFVKVVQKMENVGNVKISGKLLKELSEMGVKVGGTGGGLA